MSDLTYAIDLHRIAHSVFKEFRLTATVSIHPDHTALDVWHLKVRQPPSKRDVAVRLYCGAGVSPITVRYSLKRQLGLTS